MGYQGSYWSCSKFADKIRGSMKPSSATSKGWRDWKDEAKEKHPVRYWLAEEGLDKIQDFIFWPATKLNNVRYYINNRWVTRGHALTAHPRDIKPGDWCDVGNRFLPCLFNELVDFVEVETAWHHVMWNDEARKEYNPPWWRSGWLRWRTWRSPAAGLAHLKWAADLTNAEFIDKDETPELTHQAIAAREILALYTWWTEVYPKRPDPHDASGWSEHCETRRLKGDDLFDEKTDDEKVASRYILDKCNEIETAYDEEDTAMLTRLIQVRRSLWT